MAGDYFITHKLSANNYGGFYRSSQSYRVQNYRPPQSKSPRTQSSKEGNTQSCPSGQGKGPSSSMANTPSGDSFKSSMPCSFCKKPGHLISSCWKVKAKQKSLQESAPTGCAVSMRRSGSSQAVKKNNVASEKVIEDFEPFVLEVVVSLVDKFDPKPIKIMRDTCCSHDFGRVPAL